MSPEDLSQYLLSKGLDPDAVQETLIVYMTWQGPPIRYPKAWAWRHVYWRTKAELRKRSIRGKRKDLDPLMDSLVSAAPSPLTRAEQRQRIERFAQTMKTSCKPSHKWSIWNQREV